MTNDDVERAIEEVFARYGKTDTFDATPDWIAVMGPIFAECAERLGCDRDSSTSWAAYTACQKSAEAGYRLGAEHVARLAREHTARLGHRPPLDLMPELAVASDGDEWAERFGDA